MRDLENKKEYNRQYACTHAAEAIERTRLWRENPENKAKERRRARDYNRYRKDRHLVLARRRLKAHGLTQERYDAKVKSQNNACAVLQSAAEYLKRHSVGV